MRADFGALDLAMRRRTPDLAAYGVNNERGRPVRSWLGANCRAGIPRGPPNLNHGSNAI